MVRGRRSPLAAVHPREAPRFARHLNSAPKSMRAEVHHPLQDFALDSARESEDLDPRVLVLSQRNPLYWQWHSDTLPHAALNAINVHNTTCSVLIFSSYGEQDLTSWPPRLARRIHDAISADGRRFRGAFGAVGPPAAGPQGEKVARRIAGPRRTVRTPQIRQKPYALCSKGIGSSESEFDSRRERIEARAEREVRVQVAHAHAIARLRQEPAQAYSSYVRRHPSAHLRSRRRRADSAEGAIEANRFRAAGCRTRSE